MSKKCLNAQVTLDEQEEYCEWAKNKGNNLITRHQRSSCSDLRNFDQSVSLNDVSYKSKSFKMCYGCNKLYKTFHPVYVYSCNSCGNMFQKMRTLTKNLTGHTAVVIGGRTKIGHQVIVKLLDAGCCVHGTTRYPEEAIKTFSTYNEWAQWRSRLHFHNLDLDTPSVEENINELIKNINCDSIDILINCAAQTIRAREKNKIFMNGTNNDNRYNEPKHVEGNNENSWLLQIDQINQREFEEVHRINSIAPCIIIKCFIPLLQRSDVKPYIINVHAREGLFEVHKGNIHYHTNMAKASLSMLTKCLAENPIKTNGGIKISIHGCDPGWISVDEYYSDNRPWIYPPLDEIDGASRIVYPIFKGLSSCPKTRRHFNVVKY